MITTRNNHERNVMLFQMVVSVAHEICHVLTGFFSGRARPLTPRTVTVEGPLSEGEAGRWWEVEALGGIPEFYARRDDRDNPDQSGTPYLFPVLHQTSLGTEISPTYIDQFALGGE